MKEIMYLFTMSIKIIVLCVIVPMTTIFAAQIEQIIEDFKYSPPRLSVGSMTKLSAIATSRLTPVVFNSETPAICTTSRDNGYLVTGLSVGLCMVTAKQAGNEQYKPATPTSIPIMVNKGIQTISNMKWDPNTLSVDNMVTLSATASSKLPVKFRAITPDICSLIGNTVTARVVGTCIISANQAGNVNYNAAPKQSISIQVTQGVQIIGPITFNSSTLTVGSSTTASATATSGLPVTFRSTTENICVTNGGLIIGIAKGICIVTAIQAGNVNYQAAAQKIANITVTNSPKLNQTIPAIIFSPTSLVIGNSATVSANATSGLAVSFRVTTPTCTLVGNTITSVSAGICTVVASQIGNASYNAAPELIQNLTINKLPQSIGSIIFTPASWIIGGSTTVTANASSGLPVSFRSTTLDVCTLLGNTLTSLKAGTCTIVANQSGDTRYQAAAQVTANSMAGKTPQTISGMNFSPTSVTLGENATVSASVTSGLTVTFRSTTPSICAVLNNTVTSISVGTCIIAANQVGNSTYDAASEVIQSFIIDQARQSIGEITFTPAALIEGKTTIVSAIATSGLEVFFSSSTPSICTVSGSTVAAVTAGTCTVIANQPGNVNYYAAPQTIKNVTVSVDSSSRQSFEPEMVSIPAGTFKMGSPPSEVGRWDDEGPVHSVTVAAFEMSKYEVTFDEYDSFTDATGKSKLDDSGWGRGKRPVINVSWNEATDYAKWLSTQTGKNYRLPTEAEWEYAARAGTTTAYWWGNSIGNNRANCDGCGSQWDNTETAPVGSFSANPWGLYDTVGNVREWTCSAWSDPYDGSEKVCQTNSDVSRVVRGGSWYNNPASVRAAYRDDVSPDYRNYDVGFRLARTPF